jgi:hypothetical protein
MRNSIRTSQVPFLIHRVYALLRRYCWRVSTGCALLVGRAIVGYNLERSDCLDSNVAFEK